MSDMTGLLPLHPLAELFPAMNAEEFEGFKASIEAHGQKEPIETYKGQVIDGRHRQRACAELGLIPLYVEFTGPDPLGHVLAKNLDRRHLTTSQRAVIAANLVTWEKGMNQHTAGADGAANLPTRAAAARMSISERLVTAANNIRQTGSKVLFDAIRDGKLTINSADAFKALPDPEINRILASGKRAVLEEAKRIRTEVKQVSRDVRLGMMTEIATRGQETAPPGSMPRGVAVLYVDVPWQEDRVWDAETGSDKGYPYPTMPLEEIKALCAGDASPAADDAVLFFWTTGNRWDIAIDVIRAWGFEYVSRITWDKVNPGTGRWVIDQSEDLLICKRGNPPCPFEGTQPRSVYAEKKADHSAKPAHFRAVIDRMFPGVPKLELFARGKPPRGWTFWGYGAEAADADGAAEVAPADAVPVKAAAKPKPKAKPKSSAKPKATGRPKPAGKAKPAGGSAPKRKARPKPQPVAAAADHAAAGAQ